MEIHVIRSGELPENLFGEIMLQIKQRSGPAQFKAAGYTAEWDSGDFNHWRGYPCLTKNQFYQKCRDYRNEKGIQPDTVVVLLTNHPDFENWFSAGEYGGEPNFFIHAAGWDYFVESDPIYPVIYELASIPLLVRAYGDYAEAVKAAHHEPRGCYLDMCANKRDIHLKMRTADVCPSCRKHFMEAGLDSALVRQVLSVYEDVRVRMLYRERIELLEEPAVMEINVGQRTLGFPSVHPEPIKLTPQEMMVYSFFLNHPKGVYFRQLPDHLPELVTLYGRLSDNINETAIHNSISNLVDNPIKILNPVISRINKFITNKVGPRIDSYYKILSNGAQHRIAIDRKYVVQRFRSDLMT